MYAKDDILKDLNAIENPTLTMEARECFAKIIDILDLEGMIFVGKTPKGGVICVLGTIPCILEMHQQLMRGLAKAATYPED